MARTSTSHPWHAHRAMCAKCTPYGAAVAQGVLTRATPSHQSFVSAVCTLARYAAGGEIPWPTFERLAWDLGQNLGREHEARKTMEYCRGKGEGDPRSAPTDGTIPLDKGDIVTALIDWRDRSVPLAASMSSHGTLVKIIDALFVDAVGVAAASDRRKVSGAWDVRMSHRQLAEAAGVSRRTIENTLPSIARFVRVIPRGGARTTIWRISLSTTEASPEFAPVPQGQVRPPSGGGEKSGLDMPTSAVPVSLPGSNAWYRSGNAYRVWHALDRVDAVAATTLAAALGIGRSTTFGILGRLAADGLAESTPDGWLRIDPPDDESFASIDHAARRRQLHDAERRVYRAVVREMAKAKEASK